MEVMTIKQFKGNSVEVKTKNGVRLYYYNDCLAYLNKGVLTLNSNKAVYNRTAVRYLNIWLDYWLEGVKYKDIKDKAKKFDFGSVRCYKEE